MALDETPLCLPASPPQRGRSIVATSTLLSQRRRKAATAECVISPLEGEMPGRAEGGLVERDLT
jgi:hypothetical protein